MSAMLFGDKSAVDSYEKTLMYRAGIGHIMAVSGVHLSVVCSFFWFILSKLPINKFLRFGLLLVPIACFVLLAGMSNSVLRAAVMIILVYGAGLFRRRADTFNSLGIAVILLTVQSPFAVRDASFLLSAAGVFGIGVAGPAFVENIRNGRHMNGAVKTLLLSFCVMVTVFPVSILFFDEVSVISPLSNLLLLPICEIILIGGVIVTLTGGAAFAAVPVLKVCGICCRAVIEASEFIGGLGFSYIPLGSGYVRIIFLAALAAVILSAVLLRNSKITAELSVAILAGAISLTSLYRVLPDDRVTVAVLKDGNAVSAVVHDKNSACVVDLYKGGMAVDPVVKYLNRNGISDIDAVILNADANYSFPVYVDRLRLFDTGMLLVPEEDKALTAGIAEDSLSYYRKNNGCIEMNDYSLCFFSDGVVTVTAGEAEIIMYGSEAVIAGEDTYSAAVRYSGKNAGGDPESSIIAAMNDKAEVTVSKNKTVYIGENVRFVIESNGEVKSEKIK